MSLTITYKEGEGVLDKCGYGYKMITGAIAFDDSYPTGGETLDLSKKMPTDIHMVMFAPKSGYIFEYDYTNKKVKAFYPAATHTHVFSGSALATHAHAITLTDADGAAAAGVTVYFDEDATLGARLLFVSPTDASGTENTSAVSAGTPAGTNAANASAVAVEVTSAADLSALTDVRFMAIGK